MPGDLGTYLVLTGNYMHGNDAIDLGMADMKVLHHKGFEWDIVDAIQQMDKSSWPHFDQIFLGHRTPWNKEESTFEEDLNHAKLNDLVENTTDDYYEFRKRNNDDNYPPIFRDPRDNKPDPVAYADLKYKEMIRRKSRAHYGTDMQGDYFAQHNGE